MNPLELLKMARRNHIDGRLAAVLSGDSSLTYAMDTDLESDEKQVIVAILKRNTEEVLRLGISKSEYDGIKMLELVEKHGVAELPAHL